MKNYFAKYLPVKDEIVVGDIVNIINKPHPDVVSFGKVVDILDDSFYLDNSYNVHKPDYEKVKLFICTTDIKVGDKTFPFLRGHCDDIEKGPFNEKINWDTKDFMSGWPDDPHIIENLNYDDYKPYRISTDKGFGSPGRYIKVIGQVSDDAIWVKEGDDFDEGDILISYTLPVTISSPARELIKNAEFDYYPSDGDVENWSDDYLHYNGGRGTTWNLDNVMVSRVKVKCDKCETFH